MKEKKFEIDREAAEMFSLVLSHPDHIDRFSFFARLTNGAEMRYTLDRRQHDRMLRAEKRTREGDNDIFSAITHIVGAVGGVATLVLLVVFAALRHDLVRVLSFTLYGTVLISFYLSSVLYHFFYPADAVRPMLFAIKRATALILLAVTALPFCAFSGNQPFGWIVFSAVAFVAVASAVLRSFVYTSGTLAYGIVSLALACVPLMFFGEIIAHSDLLRLIWFIAGFAGYVLWILLQEIENAKPSRGLFGIRDIGNLAILAGSSFYYWYMVGYVL